MITLRDWMINHIGENPNISFGSIYRDVCLANNKFYLEPGSRIHDEIFKNVELLKKEEIILESKHSSNSFYILNKQLTRNSIIENLLS